MAKQNLKKLYTLLARDKQTGKYYGMTSFINLDECKSIIFTSDMTYNLGYNNNSKPNSENQKIWFYLREKSQMYTSFFEDRFVIKPYRVNSKSCPVKFDLRKMKKKYYCTYAPFKEKFKK